MIISGLQIGNVRWLASHLQNAADNETVELAEVRGTVAQDIDGALAEFDALTAGTKAKEGIYAAFINPPEKLTREQYVRAIQLIEDRLGLTGQPRLIVYHAKQGREHVHVAWSRIDIDRLKAIHLSHDKMKLRKCAQELGALFGLTLPFGLMEDRGVARFDKPKQPTKAEKAQAAHSGIAIEERRATITDAWRRSDSAEAFQQALEEAGYMLARGDSRAFVVVDIAGDVHSPARQIEGAKTKDVKAKLAGLNLALLPPVERAKILMLQRMAAQHDAARAEAKRKATGEAEYGKLTALQKKRRGEIDLLWQKMKIRHMHEWKVLLAHFAAEREHHLSRRKWEAWGLAVYLKKIAVIRQLIEYYERKQKRTMEELHQALEASLRRRHENEAIELKRRYDAMQRLERRELVSFEQRHIGHAGSISYALVHEQLGRVSGTSGQFEITRPHDPNWTALREKIADAISLDRAEIARLEAFAVASPIAAQLAHPPSDWLAFQENKPDIIMSLSPDFLAFIHQNAADITEPAEETRTRRRTERMTPKPNRPAGL